MKVFIDGKQVECNNDVKIIYEGKDIGHDEMVSGELHLTITNEALIADTFKDNGKMYLTMWEDLADIIEKTH